MIIDHSISFLHRQQNSFESTVQQLLNSTAFAEQIPASSTQVVASQAATQTNWGAGFANLLAAERGFELAARLVKTEMTLTTEVLKLAKQEYRRYR